MQIMSLIKNGSPEAPSVANPTLVFQHYSSPTPLVYSLFALLILHLTTPSFRMDFGKIQRICDEDIRTVGNSRGLDVWLVVHVQTDLDRSWHNAWKWNRITTDCTFRECFFLLEFCVTRIMFVSHTGLVVWSRLPFIVNSENHRKFVILCRSSFREREEQKIDRTRSTRYDSRASWFDGCCRTNNISCISWMRKIVDG